MSPTQSVLDLSMKMIQDILNELGITRRYKGFAHTAYAIQLAVADEDRLCYVTKEIYEATALHFGSTWSCVERNIRTIVARAWQINQPFLGEMARYPLSSPPTASEFIEIISSYVLRSLPPQLAQSLRIRPQW